MTARLEDAPPLAAAGPFELPGGPDAALLLHGFTGTPWEVRPVAERLNALGMRCLAPVLPGHEGGAEGLAGVPWTAWADAARRELQLLAGARRTFVVGSSMGALLALALAHEEPSRVTGLALLAPALRLTLAARLAAAACRVAPLHLLKPFIQKTGGSDIRDPEARRANPCMTAIPLRGVVELVDLGRHVDGLLPAVTSPALILVGGEDHTVDNAGARRIARRLGSGPARVVRLARSYHLVGVDVERERCAEEVAAFFCALRE